MEEAPSIQIRRLHAWAATGGWLRSAISAPGSGMRGLVDIAHVRGAAPGARDAGPRTRPSRTWPVGARSSDAPSSQRLRSFGRDRGVCHAGVFSPGGRLDSDVGRTGDLAVAVVPRSAGI